MGSALACIISDFHPQLCLLLLEVMGPRGGVSLVGSWKYGSGVEDRDLG